VGVASNNATVGTTDGCAGREAVGATTPLR
jgi:hypothetical protein